MACAFLHFAKAVYLWTLFRSYMLLHIFFHRMAGDAPLICLLGMSLPTDVQCHGCFPMRPISICPWVKRCSSPVLVDTIIQQPLGRFTPNQVYCSLPLWRKRETMELCASNLPSFRSSIGYILDAVTQQPLDRITPNQVNWNRLCLMRCHGHQAHWSPNQVY